MLLLVLTAILLGTGEVLAPGFASSDNMLQLLKLSSFLGIAAIGQTIVMLTGGIDLSIAWVITGSGRGVSPRTAMARTPTSRWPRRWRSASGSWSGLVNGFGVVKLKISPIVMTLAMNNIMLGATLVYTGGTPSGGSGPLVRSLATGNVFGGVPAMVILWCLLAALTIIGVRWTRGGRKLLAVGENPRVSYLTGIDNDRVTIAAYAVSGIGAALTGILFAAFSGATFLGMGDQFVLPTIAAVVLGGTSMFGGRGGYGGTVAAVIFTTILTTVLVIGSIPQGVRSIAYGIAVLAAIIAQRLLIRRDDLTQ